MRQIKFTHMGSLILIPNTINKVYVGSYFSFTTIKPCSLNNFKFMTFVQICIGVFY